MNLFAPLETPRPRLIGMIHVPPTPGCPGWSADLQQSLRSVEADAAALLEGGVDAILLENMHDVPYLRSRVEPETVAAMAIYARRVRECAPHHPVGIQVLAGANREALGTAVAAGLNFLRVEAFAYAHVADEGWIQASAAELIRARYALRADDILILADIKKKHSSHAITADLSIESIAEGTEFCGADGLIITGSSTGKAPDAALLARVRAVSRTPVIIGSGVSLENVDTFRAADALIVGTALKEGSDWRRAVDVSRVKRLSAALRRAG